MRRIPFWALLFLSFSGPALAADTGSVTWSGPEIIAKYDGVRKIVRYTAAILSDDDTEGVAGTALTSTKALQGELLWFEAHDGATTPTTAWDATLANALGTDVLGGVGANVPTTGTLSPPKNTVATAVPCTMPLQGVHTLSITNMGASKTATVRLYVAE